MQKEEITAKINLNPFPIGIKQYNTHTRIESNRTHLRDLSTDDDDDDD